MPYKNKSDKAAYMRRYRLSYSLSPEQRLKDTSRHIAGVYKRRGKLQWRRCEDCGATECIEMHHPDHGYPLLVIWLCRPCHRNHHADPSLDSLPPLDVAAIIAEVPAQWWQ